MGCCPNMSCQPDSRIAAGQAAPTGRDAKKTSVGEAFSLDLHDWINIQPILAFSIPPLWEFPFLPRLNNIPCIFFIYIRRSFMGSPWCRVRFWPKKIVFHKYYRMLAGIWSFGGWPSLGLCFAKIGVYFIYTYVRLQNLSMWGFT